MSHADKIKTLSNVWEPLAISNNNIISAIAHKERPIYAVQFHPEVTHTQYGSDILSNFLFKICKLNQNWTAENFINDTIKKIRKEVGKNEIICGIESRIPRRYL